MFSFDVRSHSSALHSKPADSMTDSYTERVRTPRWWPVRMPLTRREVELHITIFLSMAHEMKTFRWSTAMKSVMLSLCRDIWKIIDPVSMFHP